MVIHIFTFIVLAFLHFSSFTLAPWLHQPHNVAPPTPGDDVRKTCFGWIMFYNFESSASQNKNLARGRDKQYDNNVSEYAVIYAHVLVAFSGDLPMGPSTFCSHQLSGDVGGRFIDFASSNRQCAGWIHMYGFHFDDYKKNRKLAKKRDKTEDNNISCWVAGYAQFIERKEYKSKPISIQEYCNGMGVDSRTFYFISFDGTRKTCKEWINMSGFGDEDNMNNLDRARLQRKTFMNFINVFTRLYIEHLKSFAPKNSLFCQSSPGVTDGLPMTPALFCETNGYGDVPRTYYNNQLPN